MMETLRRADGDAARDRARAYAALLEEYLAGGGEAALRQAYETGRAAIADGLGVLEISTMHHDALAIVLQDGSTLNRRLQLAEELFAESLSPYEMAHRGFQEAVSALRRMNETLEQEIHRIAHAVHDDAGQILMVAKLAISRLAPDVSASSQGRLEEVTALLDQVDQQLRRLSHELRPTILDDLGLVPALQFLADGVSRRGEMSVAIENTMEHRCGPSVEVAAYRVIQEALTNTAKHARATCVKIQIAEVANQLHCVVRDDGVGFDVAAVLARTSNRGLGLLGMRERVSAVGGTLLIESRRGRGTVLQFKLPMER
jgi:signal transduction histidine kinase